MARPVRIPLVGLVVAVVVTMAGCGGASGTGRTSSTPVVTLTIYAAASLRDALVPATDAYAAASPGTRFTVSTDSSAALETKIEQGAPADVFLSADLATAQRLVDAGLAAGTVVPFARNTLTVIVPAGNPAGIHSPADLARRGVKVVAAGDAVPITKYADQLVGNLARLVGYPAAFAASYEANVASREDNVAAVVAKIALGEGDAAIVYVTDAHASGKVETIGVPAAANVTATYGGVVVKSSSSRDSATEFLDWLAGPEGQAILARYGFASGGGGG